MFCQLGSFSELIHLHAAFVVIFLKPPPVEFDAQWDTPSHTLSSPHHSWPPTVSLQSLCFRSQIRFLPLKKRGVALYFPFTHNADTTIPTSLLTIRPFQTCVCIHRLYTLHIHEHLQRTQGIHSVEYPLRLVTVYRASCLKSARLMLYTHSETVLAINRMWLYMHVLIDHI